MNKDWALRDRVANIEKKLDALEAKLFTESEDESERKILIENNIKKMEEGKMGEVSDGDHTFNDLYNHRVVLYASLCNLLANSDRYDVWKTWNHDDGSSFDGWFLVGVKTPSGEISYHCEEKYFDFFHCKEIEKAPPFDGYTSDDVLGRLIEEFCK